MGTSQSQCRPQSYQHYNTYFGPSWGPPHSATPTVGPGHHHHHQHQMRAGFGFGAPRPHLPIRLTTAINVGGALSQNTIWTKANNPYNVIADIYVPTGIALTIKAGVKIFLMVANLSQSSIAYADFIGNKQAVRVAQNFLEINTGEFLTQYCTFTNTQLFMGAEYNHSFTGKTKNAIVIQDSTLINSVVSNHNVATRFIKFIRDSFQNILLDLLAPYDTTQIVECRGGNVTIHWRGYPGYYFEMNDTILTNVTIDYHTLWVPEGTGTIRRSMLRNATIDMFGEYVDYVRNTFKIISSKITISRPIELETGSIECSSISPFEENSNSVGVIAGAISIHDSSIFGFDVGLRIENFSKPMNNITNNNFYRNSRYNIENLGKFDVNAVGNWWGRLDKLGTKLYDNCDDEKSGKISYHNYTQQSIEQQC
ncbi:hypothetical protein I4U23_012378 [Adineta vaga]|nr:hypothetical protein I4U23_012378 [Adineta vaga]